jgi:hypothetical protein
LIAISGAEAFWPSGERPLGLALANEPRVKRAVDNTAMKSFMIACPSDFF